MQPEIKLSLPIEYVNVIGAALRKMPWEVANPVIARMDAQIRKAMEPAKTETANTPELQAQPT